jgi:3',5'-cyclic AMP phosphodiesterase CpdA
VGAGDIAECGVPGAAATARLLDGIQGTVVALGDNAYPDGAPANYADCFGPTWGRHKSRIRPIPGNHDYQTAGASGYFAYFGGEAGRAGDGYYSFRAGSWLVVALNSNVPMGVGSAQYQWLQGELSAAPGPCVAALMHHPRYTSGPNGENPHVWAIFELLHTAGVELVLSGHDHVYERFAPQNGVGRADAVRGVRQFVTGTGGAPLYEFGALRPNSEVRIRSWGVLRLDLENGRYAWEFVPVSGGERDTGTDTCH